MKTFGLRNVDTKIQKLSYSYAVAPWPEEGRE